MGVLQGGVASPVLWILYLNSVLATWRQRLSPESGVKVVHHSDGCIRALQRNHEKREGTVENITDVEFADDCVLLMRGLDI